MLMIPYTGVRLKVGVWDVGVDGLETKQGATGLAPSADALAFVAFVPRQ